MPAALHTSKVLTSTCNLPSSFHDNHDMAPTQYGCKRLSQTATAITAAGFGQPTQTAAGHFPRTEQDLISAIHRVRERYCCAPVANRYHSSSLATSRILRNFRLCIGFPPSSLQLLHVPAQGITLLSRPFQGLLGAGDATARFTVMMTKKTKYTMCPCKGSTLSKHRTPNPMDTLTLVMYGCNACTDHTRANSAISTVECASRVDESVEDDSMLANPL